jgi:hypothetical protein
MDLLDWFFSFSTAHNFRILDKLLSKCCNYFDFVTRRMPPYRHLSSLILRAAARQQRSGGGQRDGGVGSASAAVAAPR